MDKLGRIIRYVTFSILLIVFAFMLIIHLPSVQTALTRKATEMLEEYFDADISLHKVYFKPVNSVVLKDLVIVDRNPFCETARDTLASVGTLSARLSFMTLINPLKDGIVLNSVSLHEGQFNLVIESGMYSCNLLRMFRMTPGGPKKELPDRTLLTIKKIELDNIRGCMQNFSHAPFNFPATAIDWNNLIITRADIKARDFKISHGLFSGTVESMSASETSGWNIRSLTGRATVGKGVADIRDLVLHDDESMLEMDYRMTGRSSAYKNYVDSVVMDIDIHRSRLSLRSLSHFVPPFNNDPNTFLCIEGKAEGTVRDMRGNPLHIRMDGGRLGTTLKGSIKGLPDFKNMDIDAEATDLYFTTADVSRLVNATFKKAHVDLSRFGKGEVYSGSLKAKGNINNLTVKANISQGADDGSMSADLKVQNMMKMGQLPIRISGKASTRLLELDKLLGMPILGPISAKTSLSATLPAKGMPLQAKADSLIISSMAVKGYTYGNIHASASLSGRDVTAGITARDNALDADIDITSSNGMYHGTADLRMADLAAMKIDPRPVSKVSLRLDADMSQDIGNPRGKAAIRDIFLKNSDDLYKVDNIDVRLDNDNGQYDMRLDSKMMNASFRGNRKSFKGSFSSDDTTPLLSFILPGLYLESDSHAEVEMDDRQQVSARLHSGRIAYNSSYLKDVNLLAGGHLDSLAVNLDVANIKAAGFVLDNSSLRLEREGREVDIDYVFDNKGTQGDDQLRNGKFSATVNLKENGCTGVTIHSADFNAYDGRWHIPYTTASFKGKEISINQFELRNSDKWVRVDGRISAIDKVKLKAKIHNLDLAMVNNFVKKFDLDLKGMLNADATINSPLRPGIPECEFSIKGDRLAMGSTTLGDLRADCIYDNDSRSFNISATDIINYRKVLDVKAGISPADADMDLKIKAAGFPIDFVRMFIPTVFDRLSGQLWGEYNVSGPFKALNISSSEAAIHNGVLGIGFTKVPYDVDGTFHMDNHGVHIDEAYATDRYNGKGQLRGGLMWNRFKNMFMDISIDADNIQAIDIPLADAMIIYGNIFATGTVNIRGPFKNMTMTANATVSRPSQAHIVMNKDVNASAGNLLTFINPNAPAIDRYELILNKFRKKEEAMSNFNINLHAVADQLLGVSIDLGNTGFAASLEGTGTGAIDMEFDTANKDFRMFGDYTVTEGTFNANAGNLVRKNFNISSGSSIKFNGDIYDSTVDMNATYQTKAPIAYLIADNSSVSSRRIVNCGINIQDKLFNPEVKFSIDIPDLDPTTKSAVESALSTEDKIQKQFLSLLLSGNFLPDDQSGIVNNSSLLYSSVSEMMANQVNNIFSKLEIPVDLGLNYQLSDSGSNLFDVALSTQLFNNRVIVGGTVGNRQNLASNEASIVGDLDVQIKLDRPGAFRVNLFSHSADQYTRYLDNSQRNGVGITWQQEFDRLKVLVRKLFSNKAGKAAIAEEEAARARRKTTIVLDD